MGLDEDSGDDKGIFKNNFGNDDEEYEVINFIDINFPIFLIFLIFVCMNIIGS